MVIDLGTHPHRLSERTRADRDDHELLEVDLVVGVRPAVDHVHHRHREHVGRLAAQVAPQRQPLLGGRGVGRRQRDRENRVGSEARLGRRAVERDQHPVERRLARGVLAVDRGRDLAVDVLDGPRHALAEPVRATVAELGRLELAGRRAGGNRRPSPRAGAQAELDLDRRVPAAVEDLPRVDMLDLAHFDSGSPSLHRARA